MASYLDINDLAAASCFRARIKIAAVSVAAQVLSENQTELGETEAQKRIGLATQAMRSPDGVVDQFVWPVVINPSVATKGMAATDDEIAWCVSQAWNLVAGVTQADQASKQPAT